jgi:hypothetical protein
LRACEETNMSPSVFNAALRATARVAFTAALAGCGGAILDNDAARDVLDSEAGSDTASGADVATTDAARRIELDARGDAVNVGDGSLACNAPPPGSLVAADAAASRVSASMFDCCLRELAPRIGDAGTDSLDAAAPDPSVVACCSAVLFVVDHAEYAVLDAGEDSSAGANIARFEELGWHARATCCAVAADPRGVTCEGWGPPTPPAMPNERSFGRVA